MKRWFSNLPLAAKLRVMIGYALAVVLLVFGAVCAAALLLGVRHNFVLELLALLLAGLAGYALAVRLQHAISRPISELIQIAHRVDRALAFVVGRFFHATLFAAAVQRQGKFHLEAVPFAAPLVAQQVDAHRQIQFHVDADHPWPPSLSLVPHG